MLHGGDLICEGIVRALKSVPQAAAAAAPAGTEAARTGAVAAPTGAAVVPPCAATAPAGEASAPQETTAGQVRTGHPIWTHAEGLLRKRFCSSCCQMPSQVWAEGSGVSELLAVMCGHSGR